MESGKARKLIFIGAPGSGKTTLSSAYGERNGKTVFHVDDVFTRRYGDIDAFFAARGEVQFRRIERELVMEAIASDCDIVDCGGGIVLDKTAMAALRMSGDIVRLTAHESVLAERIKNSDRPLKARLHDILIERESLYDRYADYTVDTSTGDAVQKLRTSLTSPRPNRYDTVFCDADDTVLDFHRAMRYAIADAAKSLGVDRPSESVIAAYQKILPDVWGKLERGEITREELPRLRFTCLADMLGVEFYWRDFNDAYMSAIKSTRFVRDGALEFLDALRARNIKVYIITNSYKAVASERLKALDGHVDGCYISEDIGFDKPDTRFFEWVHESVGSPDKSRIVVFGDGVFPDIHGGNLFGADTCLYDPSGKKQSDAVYTVKDYGEFERII